MLYLLVKHGISLLSLDHSYLGRSGQVKQQIIDMAMNGSGIRYTAKVLHISLSTVIKELKKK
ncbi:hypothetical protein C7B70_15075 [Chlorogloea sp. CCALA 695]|nr:hypothetical protein C7B70_15075 [Chlorogloea sp. CCALA 695]